MNDQEKSELPIRAMKSANKAEQSAAESVEQRGSAKGNAFETTTRRTPSRESVSPGLERVRQTAKGNRKCRFTALMHHVTLELLRHSYFWLKRNAAAPIYDIMGDKFLISALFTTEGYAKTHPDIVRKFEGIILSANRWANKNRALSARILAKYADVAISPTATRVTYADAINPADAQPVLDMLSKYGVLKTPLRASDLFLPEALSATGI